MSRRRPVVRRAVAAVAMLSFAACTDAPTSLVPPTTPSATAARFWDVGSSVYWNGIARDLLAATPSAGNPAVQARLLTYLSIAQYDAIIAAEDAKDRGDRASPAAAAAGASVAFLKAFFPQAQATIDGRLAEQLARAPWPGEQRRDIDAGLAVGQTVGAAVNAYAATDGAGVQAAPPNPGGPGRWTGSNSVTTLYGARLLVLDSAKQFLPPPPPAFGSPAYVAALNELRTMVLQRTTDQIASAYAWAPRNNASLNEVATDLIARHHRSERDAARILAVANMAGFDVLNACFTAKFVYYYIRPSQVDASITFLPGLGLPNHPSYPSGHSCVTAAFATVLASEFPSETSDLDAMVDEAGLSRMYAGFHYRFDVEAGQALGRNVGRLAAERGPDGHAAIPLD